MNSSQILNGKQYQILNSKKIKPKTILKFKKIKKKEKQKKNIYLRRTRTYKPKKCLPNIPISMEDLKNFQIPSELNESTTNSFETFDFLDFSQEFGTKPMKSTYDLVNIVSPYSECIFGETTTISDMSHPGKKYLKWGRNVFIISNLNRQGK